MNPSTSLASKAGSEACSIESIRSVSPDMEMVWLHPVPGCFVHAPTRYDHTVAMAAVYSQLGYPSEGRRRASSLAGSRHLDGDSVSPHRKGPNLLICAVEAPGVENVSQPQYFGGLY